MINRIPSLNQFNTMDNDENYVTSPELKIVLDNIRSGETNFSNIKQEILNLVDTHKAEEVEELNQKLVRLRNPTEANLAEMNEDVDSINDTQNNILNDIFDFKNHYIDVVEESYDHYVKSRNIIVESYLDPDEYKPGQTIKSMELLSLKFLSMGFTSAKIFSITDINGKLDVNFHITIDGEVLVYNISLDDGKLVTKELSSYKRTIDNKRYLIQFKLIDDVIDVLFFNFGNEFKFNRNPFDTSIEQSYAVQNSLIIECGLHIHDGRVVDLFSSYITTHSLRNDFINRNIGSGVFYDVSVFGQPYNILDNGGIYKLLEINDTLQFPEPNESIVRITLEPDVTDGNKDVINSNSLQYTDGSDQLRTVDLVDMFHRPLVNGVYDCDGYVVVSELSLLSKVVNIIKVYVTDDAILLLSPDESKSLVLTGRSDLLELSYKNELDILNSLDTDKTLYGIMKDGMSDGFILRSIDLCIHVNSIEENNLYIGNSLINEYPLFKDRIRLSSNHHILKDDIVDTGDMEVDITNRSLLFRLTEPTSINIGDFVFQLTTDKLIIGGFTVYDGYVLNLNDNFFVKHENDLITIELNNELLYNSQSNSSLIKFTTEPSLIIVNENLANIFESGDEYYSEYIRYNPNGTYVLNNNVRVIPSSISGETYVKKNHSIDIANAKTSTDDIPVKATADSNIFGFVNTEIKYEVTGKQLSGQLNYPYYGEVAFKLRYKCFDIDNNVVDQQPGILYKTHDGLLKQTSVSGTNQDIIGSVIEPSIINEYLINFEGIVDHFEIYSFEIIPKNYIDSIQFSTTDNKLVLPENSMIYFKSLTSKSTDSFEIANGYTLTNEHKLIHDGQEVPITHVVADTLLNTELFDCEIYGIQNTELNEFIPEYRLLSDTYYIIGGFDE